MAASSTDLKAYVDVLTKCPSCLVHLVNPKSWCYSQSFCRQHPLTLRIPSRFYDVAYRGGGWLPPPRSQLLDKIGTKFQRLPHVFGGKESNGTIGNTVRRNRKSEIQDSGLQSGNTHISTCRHDNNEIPTAMANVFGGKVCNGNIGNTVRRNRK